MYKPSTYLVITYFPTYLPTYETYFLHKWLPRWSQKLTQLRFIQNWVIKGNSGWCTGGSWFTVATDIDIEAHNHPGFLSGVQPMLKCGPPQMSIQNSVQIISLLLCTNTKQYVMSPN
jgi:hypothetical protein